MKERTQPIVKGVDHKGELVWGLIPMPLWQQAMFPIKYAGDFMMFWWKQTVSAGDDLEEMPNLTFREWRHLHKKRSGHTGD